MLVTKEYRRERAREYAERWAFGRNPLFENYSGLGGDCTNYVSQCLYAGGCTMNYTPTYGWYYLSPTNRAPAWTGVEYFYNFITGNDGVGPYGEEREEDGLEVGDVIQLGDERGVWYHSLLVTGVARGTYYVSSHSEDSYDQPLGVYRYASARYIHIEGIRIEIPDMFGEECFERFLAGESL